MSTKIRRTKKNLIESKKVLENALGYIEVNGFNIRHSIENEVIVNPAILALIKEGKFDEAANYGTVCFIGATRIGAGVQPAEYTLGTDYGDGDELTIALELIDEAVEIAYPDDLEQATENRESDEPGRIAEALGFVFHKQSYNRSFDYDEETAREQAETLFRTALKDVHKKLDKLEKKKK